MMYSTTLEDGAYAYWEAPGSFPPTGRYTAAVGAPTHGMYVVEQFERPLPPGAVARGTGARALGVIAAPRRGMLAGIPEEYKRGAVDIVIAVVLTWFFRRR
jgi:hypothetical protein